MTERIVHICEAEPGIAYITPEGLRELLLMAGFHRVDDHTYSKRDQHVARPPHPLTQIGRRNT